jgi:hypothetical protein
MNKKSLKKTLLTTTLGLFGLFGVQNTFSQEYFIEADFNKDKHIDKMNICIEDKKASIYYLQNKGDNTYHEPHYVGTIPAPHGVLYHTSYNLCLNLN